MNLKQYGMTTVPDPKCGTKYDPGPDVDTHSDLSLPSSLALAPNTNSVHKNQKVEAADIHQWRMHMQRVVKVLNSGSGSGFNQSSGSGFGFRVRVRIYSEGQGNS